MAVTLAELLEDRLPPVTAMESESVVEAMERMLEHDYSQLPVVDSVEAKRVVGMVTAEGIARAALHVGVEPSLLSVHHAMDEHPQTAPIDETMWRALDLVREGKALVVLGSKGQLVGLLTDYDFTSYLRSLTEDSIAVADIEEAVKQLILHHYRDDDDALQEAVLAQVRGVQRSAIRDVRKVVDACLAGAGADARALTSAAFKDAFDEHYIGDIKGDFERLTLAQFINIFLDAACWVSFQPSFDLPVDAVRRLLDEAREIRNRLAHHRGALTARERDRVHYCRRLLNRVADSVVDLSASATEHASTAPADQPSPFDDDASYGTFEVLREYLEEVDQATERVSLRFSAVSDLAGRELPDLARKHRSWWSNQDESPQGRAWLDAGWRVASVNLTKQQVTFARNTALNSAYIKAFGLIYRKLERSKEWARKLPSPGGRSWGYVALLPKTGTKTAQFILAFQRGGGFRIELYIDSGDGPTNKTSFDALREHSATLDERVGVRLRWQRMNDKRACRVSVAYSEPIVPEATDEELAKLCDWVVEIAPRFYDALKALYRTVEPPEAQQIDAQVETPASREPRRGDAEEREEQDPTEPETQDDDEGASE